MRRWLNLSLVLVALLVPAVVVWAQTKGPKSVKRAQPPKFSRSDTFYLDAFKEGLVGERPNNLAQSAAAVAVTPGVPGAPLPGGAAVPVGLAGSGWSGIISATTIEDEIKALKLKVDQSITTPSDFAGKGYKRARRDLSMLAMLFGIAGEYDANVRWKQEAPVARDVFARTAANAKVGTSQVFQEAKLRKDELSDLVGGGVPFAGKQADVKAPWKDVCGRAPLMQHLEAIWEPELKPLLADQAQFTANATKIAHQAEIIAALGDVLGKEGMPDADSDDYKAFCDRLRNGGKAIAEAAKQKNFAGASTGSTEISKSCVECHENYRA